jgi:hypothetical protein
MVQRGKGGEFTLSYSSHPREVQCAVQRVSECVLIRTFYALPLNQTPAGASAFGSSRTLASS